MEFERLKVLVMKLIRVRNDICVEVVIMSLAVLRLTRAISEMRSWKLEMCSITSVQITRSKLRLEKRIRAPEARNAMELGGEAELA